MLARRFGPDRIATVPVQALDTAQVDGIVNTTPVGMAGSPESPIAPALISPRHWVVDIIYFPLETELLRIAREKACRAMNGAGMVIAQAALAFEIITGFPADKDRMSRSFFCSGEVPGPV